MTRIVGFVGMVFLGPLPRPAVPAFDGWDGVQQGFENRAIVLVRPGDFQRQRDALAIDDQVALGTRFAPIGRVRARGLPAPFGRHAAAVQVATCALTTSQMNSPYFEIRLASARRQPVSLRASPLSTL